MTDPALPRIPPLTIRGIKTFAVEVPMTYPLGTSAAIVKMAPMLLVDLETAEGITGRTYLFCYRPSAPRAIDVLLRDAVSLVAGERAVPLEIAAKLVRRFTLVGVASVVRMALAALDTAMWDALAVAAGVPLATLLGARPRPIPAYNSSGLGLMSPEAAADEAEKLLAGGFRSVKLRLGHPTLEQDLAVTRAVRKLTVPVQIGENFNGPEAMLEAIAAGACDYVMPDLARIGGVTGWIQAASLASAARLEMSSHLVPEISVHLLAATPTCHYLEYVDWANSILEEPLQIREGQALVPARPGLGLAWRSDAVKAFALGG